MTQKLAPAVPKPLPIDEALRRSSPLADLRRRVSDSQSRYALIRPSLPPAMAAHVRPGPLDEEGWSLLVANAAVAAKLRQLQPRLEQVLRQQGCLQHNIRIKIVQPDRR
jgi:hypothetical protein